MTARDPQAGGGHEPAFNLPPATAALAALLVGIHLLRQLLSPAVDEEMVRAFAFVPVHFTQGTPDALDWASLLTHMVLHGGWLHLGVNVALLLAFGAAVERVLGAGRMLVLLLASGLLALLAHTIFNAGSPDGLIGASGAVSGLFGAALWLLRRARMVSLLPALGIWFVLNAVIGLVGMPGMEGAEIAWIAHVGGLAGGLLLFPLMVRRRPGG